VNPEEAIASLRQAAAFLTELGKFKQIGKIHKDIAEVRNEKGGRKEGEKKDEWGGGCGGRALLCVYYSLLFFFFLF
jgi:hypothetical protein